MTTNRAKQRMLEGRPAIGAELGLGSPLAGELLAPLGFDFVLVDNQHGSWGDERTMYAFRSIVLGQATPMARVRQNDFGAIGRLLDSGALGVVVPMVNSAEEAERAAFAARYRPRGGRSDGPFGTGFLGPDYMDRINDEVFLAVQIETVEAVENAAETMGVEGIDGCWIGPGDLSLSLGVDAATADGRRVLESAVSKVIESCRLTSKIPGIWTPNAAETQYWIERGCLFVTAGGDAGWMLEGARETLRALGRPSDS